MRWQWRTWGVTATGGGAIAAAGVTADAPAVAVDAPAAQPPRPRSSRRWRVPGFAPAEPVTYPPPPPAQPPAPATSPGDATADASAEASADAGAAVPPGEPGVLAVAIARVLIAIDFALPGRRDRSGR